MTTFEQMSRIQRSIDSTARSILLMALDPYVYETLTDKQWLRMLRVAYPTIEEARTESSRLARDYYDTARAEAGFQRRDVNLVNYTYRMLIENTGGVKKSFQKANSVGAMTLLLDSFQKQIRNANRSTVMMAVGDDPDCPAWARVGRADDSCAFCLATVAKGPLLKSKFPKMFQPDPIHRVKATELLKQNTYKAGVELAKRFHPADDCLAVPVFDPEGDWDGKDNYLAAKKLWDETVEGKRGKEAINEVRREEETPETPRFVV